MGNALSRCFRFGSQPTTFINAVGWTAGSGPGASREVLKEINADVVALQEVVGMDEAAREHNQVASYCGRARVGFSHRGKSQVTRLGLRQRGSQSLAHRQRSQSRSDVANV